MKISIFKILITLTHSIATQFQTILHFSLIWPVIINYLRDQGKRWVNHNEPEDDVTFVVIKVK